MTDKEALEICNKAIKYIAIKYGEFNPRTQVEQVCTMIKEDINVRMLIDALEKQQIIRDKIDWLKTFNEYDTISIKEAIDAFEDCEVNIYE